MSSELEVLKQRITELEAENAEFKAKKAEFEVKKVEFLKSIKKYYTDFEGYIVKLKYLSSQYPDHLESIEALILEIKAQNAKNKSIIEEYEKELESKKNRKFQTRCIQIAKEILREEPIIEYRPSFMQGLELDAFFQKYRIALEVQGAQHRFHSTSWYKDVKKLEDIVDRNRRKRCICLDNGIFLIEVWYDQTRKLSFQKGYEKLRS